MIVVVDVLLQIFNYLNNSSLYRARLVEHLWNEIITKYRNKLFLPTWVQSYNAIKQLPSVDYVDENTDYYGCSSLGIEYWVKIAETKIMLGLRSKYPNTVTKFLTWGGDWSNYQKTDLRCLLLPSDFFQDETTHRIFIKANITDHKWVLEKIVVFDITDLHNVLFYDLGIVNSHPVMILPFLPLVKKNAEVVIKATNIYENFFTFNNQLYLRRERGCFNHIVRINDISLSILEQHHLFDVYCSKYTFTLKINVFNLIDLSSGLTVASLFLCNSYVCHSIDLSPSHFIILFGKLGPNRETLFKYYYLLIDTKRLICSRFKTKEDTSFLYSPKVEFYSTNIVHIYKKNQIVKIDLKSLKIIK